MALTVIKHFAGTNLSWTGESETYPSDTWTHRVLFVNAAQKYVVNGNAGTFEAKANVTENWEPGRYRWSWIVESGDDRHILEQGEIEIQPNPVHAGDYRTHCEKMIAAIEATLEDRATDDELSISSKGKSLARHSLEELKSLLIYYQNRLADHIRKEAAKQGKDVTTIRARFNK